MSTISFKPKQVTKKITAHLQDRASDVIMQDINIVALLILACQLATPVMLHRQFTQTLLVVLYRHSVHSGLMV